MEKNKSMSGGGVSIDTMREVSVQRVSIKDDVEILGHVFHGLKDIWAMGIRC